MAIDSLDKPEKQPKPRREKPITAEQAYRMSELSADTDYQKFQQSLGDYATTAEYKASFQKDPAAWKELSQIAGASQLLMSNENARKRAFGNTKKLVSSLNKSKKGTAPVSQVVVPDEVILPARATPADIGLPDTDLTAINEQLDRAALGMEESVSRLETMNEPLLRGEIPEDVQMQLRRAGSERVQQSGLGGQRAEARTARDFGLTSLQIRESAAERQMGIAEARRAQAAFAQGRREYEKNYQLQVRQFTEDMRRTDLNLAELEQTRRRFNAEQNLNLVKLVADLASTRAQVRAQYDVAGVEGGGDTVAGLSQVMKQIDGILSRPGRVT